MTRREWKDRYINQLVRNGLDREAAGECYLSGKGTYDFDEYPEDAADDEAYYWACDSPH